MISIARTFGAPDSVPAGNAASTTSRAVRSSAQRPGDRRLQVHDVAVAADLHELHHLDRARPADPAQVVAAEVDQHHVLGPLLGIGQQLGLQGGVLGRCRPAGLGSGDRVGDRDVALDRDQRLRAGADDVEAVQPEQVHVGARVDQPQHPVDVQRVGGGVHLEPLADHDLERLAGLDLLHRRRDRRLELLRGALAADRQRWSNCGDRPPTGSARASSAVIASTRATASAYASSTRSSVSSKLMALAISQTSLCVMVQHGEVAGQQQRRARGWPGRRRCRPAAVRAGARCRSPGSRPGRR